MPQRITSDGYVEESERPNYIVRDGFILADCGSFPAPKDAMDRPELDRFVMAEQKRLAAEWVAG